jgi:hypothetical protein
MEHEEHCYEVNGFESKMYEGNAAEGLRSHYGLAFYSKLPIIQSCNVTMYENEGNASAEYAQTTVQLNSGIQVNIVCLYRRPISPLSDMTFPLSDLLHHGLQLCHANQKQFNIMT